MPTPLALMCYRNKSASAAYSTGLSISDSDLDKLINSNIPCVAQVAAHRIAKQKIVLGQSNQYESQARPSSKDLEDMYLTRPQA